MAKQKTTKTTAPNDSPTKTDVAVAQVSRCIQDACGSTDRTPYHNVVEREIDGVDQITGQPFTHVIWRRTECKACGQARIDRHTENRVTKRQQ